LPQDGQKFTFASLSFLMVSSTGHLSHAKCVSRFIRAANKDVARAALSAANFGMLSTNAQKD